MHFIFSHFILSSDEIQSLTIYYMCPSHLFGLLDCKIRISWIWVLVYSLNFRFLPSFLYRISSILSFMCLSTLSLAIISIILMFLSLHGPQRNRRATVQTTHVQQQRLGGNVRKKYHSVIVFDYSVRMCLDVFCSDVFCSDVFCSVLFEPVVFCSVLMCSVLICSGSNLKFLVNADLWLSSRDFYWILFLFPFLSIYFCLLKLLTFTDTITLI